VQGGLRDPLNKWDFFDAPAAGNVRDRVITGTDLFRVLAHFSDTDGGGTAPINRYTDPFSAPPPTGYHPAFDRGPVIGPFPWNVGPADGSITGGDVLEVIAQLNHTCA
jgi:hypothetical protein